jgi:hypothetical protein
MFWMVVLAVAAVLILLRLYFKVRNIKLGERGSWDARAIEQLRLRGYVPFNDYAVDFFLALPDNMACEAVRAQLEPQGFTVDVKPLENDAQLKYSLHARRVMRLIVPDMEDLSRRLTVLAEQFQGRYDGWAV